MTEPSDGSHEPTAPLLVELDAPLLREDSRHIVGEPTPIPLAQPVPATYWIVRGTTPSLDSSSLGLCTLVFVAELHPIAPAYEEIV